MYKYSPCKDISAGQHHKISHLTSVLGIMSSKQLGKRSGIGESNI